MPNTTQKNNDLISRANRVMIRQERTNLNNGFLPNDHDEVLEKHEFLSSKDKFSFSGKLNGLSLISQNQ
jgi:hypothetical protein|tara:strand:- start:1687 stop:1893 length:207 start_codon:yes stop_codon:yes gene_type:complete